MNIRWKLGSVQSKGISLIILASISLAPVQPAYAAFGDGSAPTIPNASVLTAQAEEPKIDGSTGAFTQRVPLDIPPGRNGLQPDVALDYNSQRTKDGIVGYGWALSIPYIERLNKTGSENLYDPSTTHYFTSSIDGELVASATTSSAVGATPSVEKNTYGPTGWAQCTIASSVTFSKTVSATSTLLLVHVVDSQVTSVTYAGISMASVATSTGGSASTWYLVNPTIGTNNVVVNFSGSSDSVGSAVSYTGTNTSSPFGATSPANAANGNPSISITTTNDNSVIDDNLYYDLGQTLTPNSPQVSQMTESCATVVSHGASTLTTTTHGSNSLGWTHAGTDSDWQEVVVEVRSGTTTSYTETSPYAAKVDDGALNAYSLSGNTWTMYDKKGTKYTFGSDDTGRMYDRGTGTSTKTSRWMLQEVRDTNDNYVKYTYNRDSNVLYPYKITYTGHGSTDGISTVNFATSTRSDIRQSYASGFIASTTKRISQITATVNGTIVRQYDLGYGVGHNGSRSVLTSVQQKGYDDNNNLTTLPAMMFAYATSTTQFYAPGATQNILSASYVVADTNGNGINDTTLLMPAPLYGYVFPDNANPSILLQDQGVTSPKYWSELYPSLAPLERGVRYIDVNGDGKADIVRGWVDDATGQSDSAIFLNQYATSTGHFGWSASSTYSGSIPIFAKKSQHPVSTAATLFC